MASTPRARSSGFTTTATVEHGFLYSGGSYTTLDDPLGTLGTGAWGINDAGQIVGDYIDGNGAFHGFFYSGGSYTTLDDPLAVGGTVAFGINDLGRIAGYYEGSGEVFHSFLFSGGTYTNPNDLFFTGVSEGTFAEGINNAGQIVGFYGYIHGFLYSSGDHATLDYPQATGPTRAFGINNIGQIVGTYSDNSAPLRHERLNQVRLKCSPGLLGPSSGRLGSALQPLLEVLRT
jgi:uncharacterized membrane protein